MLHVVAVFVVHYAPVPHIICVSLSTLDSPCVSDLHPILMLIIYNSSLFCSVMALTSVQYYF